MGVALASLAIRAIASAYTHAKRMGARIWTTKLHAEVNTNRGAASHFSVDEKQVRQWRLKKDDLNWMPKKKKKRMEGGGRKARLPDVEVMVMAWIDEMRSGNLRVTCSGIQRKAIELARCEGDTEFTASREWFEIVLPSSSTLSTQEDFSQRLPRDLIQKVKWCDDNVTRL